MRPGSKLRTLYQADIREESYARVSPALHKAERDLALAVQSQGQIGISGNAPAQTAVRKPSSAHR